jgi:hypothetical protein
MPQNTAEEEVEVTAPETIQQNPVIATPNAKIRGEPADLATLTLAVSSLTPNWMPARVRGGEGFDRRL